MSKTKPIVYKWIYSFLCLFQILSMVILYFAREEVVKKINGMLEGEPLPFLTQYMMGDAGTVMLLSLPCVGVFGLVVAFLSKDQGDLLGWLFYGNVIFTITFIGFFCWAFQLPFIGVMENLGG